MSVQGLIADIDNQGRIIIIPKDKREEEKKNDFYGASLNSAGPRGPRLRIPIDKDPILVGPPDGLPKSWWLMDVYTL